MYHPVSYELIVKAEIERRAEIPLYHLNPNQARLERIPSPELLKAFFAQLSGLISHLRIKNPSAEPEKSISS